MRSLDLARILEKWPVSSYVLVPAGVSLVLLWWYFSGSPFLQALIAPTIQGLQPFSWREFGLLEMLQNLVLLAVIGVLTNAALRATDWPTRSALLALIALFVFVFLEEIDYGAHLVEWLTGQPQPLAPEGWDRNIHNRVTADGVQYGSYMRMAANLFVAVFFFIAPLLFRNSRHAWVRLVLPSAWIIWTVLLMVLLSRLAHALDDAGLAVIDGVSGNLRHNISEFRELNFYYLWLLYVVQLSGRLAQRAPEHHAGNVPGRADDVRS